MNKKENHWCIVCGKGYYSCDTCNEIKNFTPWRVLTDTIEHFTIYTILKDYNNGYISKEEAKELLEKCDLSEQDTFKESAKKVLSRIFTEESSAPKRIRGKKASTRQTVENTEETVE